MTSRESLVDRLLAFQNTLSGGEAELIEEAVNALSPQSEGMPETCGCPPLIDRLSGLPDRSACRYPALKAELDVCWDARLTLTNTVGSQQHRIARLEEALRSSYAWLCSMQAYLTDPLVKVRLENAAEYAAKVLNPKESEGKER